MLEETLRRVLSGGLGKAVIGAAVTVLLFFLHPVSIFPDQKVNDVFAVLGQFFYKSRIKDKVVTVLIDQDLLDQLDHDWPLPYRDLAGIAHRLACAGAEGVFFDIVPARKYNLAEGWELLESIAAGKPYGIACPDGRTPPAIPVFFADIPALNSNFITNLRAINRLFVADTVVDYNVYPPATAEFPGYRPRTEEVTPAFGLVRYYCGSDLTRDQAKPDWCPAPSVADARRPIYLSWNGNIDPLQVAVTEASGCEPPVSGNPAKFFHGVEKLFSSDRRCPPILTLNGQDLYRDNAFIALHGDPLAALKGRIVFVGVSLAGLNDAIVSPVHGQLPGVFAHAMAFDNLVSLGESYGTMPNPQQKFALVAGFALLVGIIREYLIEPDGKSRSWRGWLLILLAFILLCCANYLWLYWPPSMMVSVGVYVGGLDAIYEMLHGLPPPKPAEPGKIASLQK